MAPGSRVLIVDDDPDAVLTCCTLLLREGYKVQGVHTVDDALVALREFEPHAIILDLAMPLRDGFELAAMTRSRVVPPVVIVLSGVYSADTPAGLDKSMFDHYLTKPCDPQVLLPLLARAEPKLKR